MNARARALVVAFSLLPSTAASLLLPPLQGVASGQQDAATVEARKRFQEGVKLFDQKKYDLARTAFLQAYALKKHPDVLLNLAQTELLSGFPFDAANHFREFLRDPATANHPKRGDAEKGLADARAKVGRVQVTVDAPDAEVLIDGKKVGTSPLAEPVDVAPGPHTVEARKAGKTTNIGVVAAEGKIVIADLKLGEPAPAVVPPPPPTAKTEPPPPEKPPEKKPEKKPEPPPDEKPYEKPEALTNATGGRESFGHWATHSPVSYATLGLTVLGLGLGIGFTAAASSADSDATSLADQIRAKKDADLYFAQSGAAPCQGGGVTSPTTGINYTKACSSLRDKQDARDTDHTVATVGFIAAGVGAVAFVGGYFLTAKKDSSTGSNAAPQAPRLMLAPSFGPSLSGLSAVGTF